MKKLLFAVCLFLGFYIFLSARVIDSQWRGPNRDGVYPNESLLKKWPANGPKLLWSFNGLGEGHSSAAVTADRVYLTGMVEGKGYLFALDMKGKQIWKSYYGPEWDDGHDGARTTPTVVGNRIYLMSGHGICACFDTNGKKKWHVPLIQDFKARNLRWGMTESLLVDGDRVFCTPGGPAAMMVILNRHTGKVIRKIKGNGEKSAYCSPVIVKHGNMRLLLTMTGESLVGLNADTGDYLWKMSHITRYGINPNTPLYYKGYIYTVSGYGTGGQMYKLSPDGKNINFVWAQKKPDSQMGSAMLVDGYIYGSGHRYRGWYCLDWKTGDIRFTSKEVGKKGNIIFSDGLLYLYGENGEVALVKPNPAKLEVIGSFEINQGSGPHWSHPVIKNGRLYIRHGEVLMVYDIAG